MSKSVGASNLVAKFVSAINTRLTGKRSPEADEHNSNHTEDHSFAAAKRHGSHDDDRDHKNTRHDDDREHGKAEAAPAYGHHKDHDHHGHGNGHTKHACDDHTPVIPPVVEVVTPPVAPEAPAPIVLVPPVVVAPVTPPVVEAPDPIVLMPPEAVLPPAPEAPPIVIIPEAPSLSPLVLIDFEDWSARQLNPTSYLIDSIVGDVSTITNQYQDQGVIINGAALIQCDNGQMASGCMALAGQTNGIVDYDKSVTFEFIDQNGVNGTTSYFSYTPDKDGESWNNVTMTAKDLQGNVVGTKTFQETSDITGPIELSGIGEFHSVTVDQTLYVHQYGGIAIDDVTFDRSIQIGDVLDINDNFVGNLLSQNFGGDVVPVVAATPAPSNDPVYYNSSAQQITLPPVELLYG